MSCLEGLQVARAEAEQLVMDWEAERLAKTNAANGLEKKKTEVENLRIKNKK